jgi:hypothetical protein
MTATLYAVTLDRADATAPAGFWADGARLITPANPEGNEFDVIADTAVGQ